MSEANERGHWSPVVPCMSLTGGVSASGIPRVNGSTQRSPRAAEALDYHEAARLKQAVIEAERELEKAQQEVTRACDATYTSYTTAETRLDALEAFNATSRLPRALAADDRFRAKHRDDDPSDPRWRLVPPWFAWTTVIAAAVFDTWFYGETFRELVDSPDNFRKVPFWVSMTPGIGIAGALLVAGTLLSEPFYRRRSAAVRKERLNWAWPVLFTLFVLGVLGV
jgi:hypothetical protein